MLFKVEFVSASYIHVNNVLLLTSFLIFILTFLHIPYPVLKFSFWTDIVCTVNLLLNVSF